MKTSKFAFEINWPLWMSTKFSKNKNEQDFTASIFELSKSQNNYTQLLMLKELWIAKVLNTEIWMFYLKFKFNWVFSESESQVDLKQPKAICLLSARKTVLDTDYIGSTKYNNSSPYFNKLNFTILSMHIISRWHISKTPHNCDNYVPQLWVEIDDELSLLFTKIP